MRTAPPSLDVSVVVPVLDDAAELRGLFAALGEVDAHEVIVVDGGSADGSAELARAHATRALDSRPGRARQLNLGARHAAGDVLLFLHADSRLPPGALRDIRAALADPAVLGGCFDVGIRARGVAWRVLERAASFRARVTRVPYGDQALFVRRAVFEDLGGFPELPAFEDVALSRILKRAGRTRQLPSRVTSSARRWRSEGVLFTVLRNWIVSSLFVAGVPAEKLVDWYPKVR